MTSKIKNLPASVLDRLRNEAKDLGKPFQEVLTYYGIERFLYRLSRSDYQKRFVLKGAMVMLTWPEQITRTTRDMDFRAYVDSETEEVVRIVKDICLVEVEPDAIIYDTETISIEPIVERARYPGFRVRFMGLIDKVRIPVQIDLGFSDEVFPLPSLVSFPTILDFPSPSVFAYNVETSLSEKVEAIYYHGEINTRMNDFFDIWMISNRFSLEGELLVKAMKLTFETRDTRIERSLVEIFTEEYIASKLDLWKAYLKTIGYYSSDAGNDAYGGGAARGGYQTPVSDDFEVILERIVEFIQPPLDAVSSKNPFNLMWNPIKGWT